MTRSRQLLRVRRAARPASCRLGAFRRRRLRRRRRWRRPTPWTPRGYDVLARDDPPLPATHRRQSPSRLLGRRADDRASMSPRPTPSASGSPASRHATSRGASGCCRQPKRTALSAVYAFARRIDDIGDGEPARRRRSCRRLAEARAQAAAPSDYPDDPVLVALADAAARLPIPLAAFGELVDGCEMDVSGHQYSRPRRPGDVLPLRGRLHRSALARRVRPAARPGCDDSGGRVRRRARRRPAADQHPSRHPRGPSQRPGVPARARISSCSASLSRSATTARSTPRTVRWPSWCDSRRHARGAGTTAGCDCSTCSIGAAPPAARRWPASTTNCSCASPPIPATVMRERMSLPTAVKVRVAATSLLRGRTGDRHG